MVMKVNYVNIVLNLARSQTWCLIHFVLIWHWYTLAGMGYTIIKPCEMIYINPVSVTTNQPRGL